MIVDMRESPMTLEYHQYRMGNSMTLHMKKETNIMIPLTK